MTGACCSGPAGVRALAASLPPCAHTWRVIVPPPTPAHMAALEREGFTPAEIAAIGAYVECTACHRLAWGRVRRTR